MPAASGVDQLETSLVTFPDEGLVPSSLEDEGGESCLVPPSCTVTPSRLVPLVQRYEDQLRESNEELDGAWASLRARLDNHEGGRCSDRISELLPGEDLGHTTPGRKRPRTFLTRECVNRCLQGSQSGEDGSPVGYGWHDSGTAQSSTDRHEFHVRTFDVCRSFTPRTTHLAWRAPATCVCAYLQMVVRSRLVPFPPYFGGGRRAVYYSLRGP
jgi:hypothetical protein